MNNQSFGSARRFRGAALLTAFFLCVVLRVAAHQGVPPPSAQQQVQAIATIPQLGLPPTDVATELAKDAGAPPPLRFAVANTVQATPLTHGAWEAVPNGRLWRLRVGSAGATDLNLGFTSFWLPKGAMLWIISETEGYYEGPYTEEHNQDYRQLWTPIVPGSSAIIELFVPADAQQEPQLELTRVNAGYRDMFRLKNDTGLAKAGSCEIDVTCPQGAPWANEIRSVCRISIGGTALCTATLIMDAPGDFRAFLLTANHCGINSGNAATVVAYWNFQAPCGNHGIGGSTAQNQTGSTFRAAKADVDFSLVELTSLPSSAYNVYYAGWDRSGAVPGNGVGIHHPNGDGKCISFANGAFSTINSCIGSGGVNTHWQVPWQNPPQGVTEPGSSGSGIFDSTSHLLLGTLSGGPSSCTATPANLWDCYGKFAISWNSGASPADRLMDWLDPSSTGILTKPGANPPATAPPNDTCTGAIPLTMGATYSMDTSGATSAGDPLPSCQTIFGKGVWFTFTAPANATYTVSTCTSTFDTVVAIYGGSCGALAQVGCNDDSCGLQSQATFVGTAGTTYYILAGGYNSLSGTLNIKVSIINDACANAIPLTSGIPVVMDTSTATSTGDPVPTCSTGGLFGNGVWFTYTPAANESISISACGSSFDTVLGVYTGTCGALTQVACDDDSGPFCPGTLQSGVTILNAIGGTTYHILAGGYNSAVGTLQIVAQLAANDMCSGAVALTDGVPYTMSTVDASSSGDPSPCGALGKGVWFTYTPPSSGIVTVDACGSSFDTVIAGYSGSCGALTQVGCNDDGFQPCGSSLLSYLEFAGTGGTLYHILAGGFSGANGNLTITPHVVPATTLNVSSFPNNVFIGQEPNDATGAFGAITPFTHTYGSNTVVELFAPTSDGFNVFLKWQLDGVDYSTSTLARFTNDINHTATAIFVPPNDQCANAVALTTGVPYNMNTAGATSTGDPSGCGGLGNGVWFTYTPTANGVVTLNACGSDYDTVVEVFSGTCGALTALQCNDDGNQCPANTLASYSEFTGTAGTTYYILAGGFNGARGNLSITANVVPATTLTVNSFPNSGVGVFAIPDDTSGQFGGNTPFNRVYAQNTVVTLFAPVNDGFNVFLKWQLDGGDYTTSTVTTFTNNMNHTAMAIYAPPNDQCTGAFTLTNGVPYHMSTLGATSTGDAPANCGALGNGVWFTYTPAVNGVVTIDTCGSSFDTAVQAYTGACGALVPVGGGGCNDDSDVCPGNSLASYAEFMGTGSTTYYVQVGGFAGARGNLTVMANVVPPANLAVNSTPNSGVSIGAAPADTGGNFGGLTPFARTYGAGTVVDLFAPASDGFNVFSKWQLDGADLTTSQSASVTANGSHTATAVYVPPNDLCAGAIVLTNGSAYAMNTAAATSTGDPLVPCGPLQKGVWFAYIPTVHEEVTISTCASSFDTMLQVFTGTCGALQRVAYGCDDDSGPACGTTRASVVFNGFPGITYFILAGGFGGNSGNLQIVATAALVNDACANALPLRFGVPFTMTTTNAASAGDPVPGCAFNSLFGKGVWFTFYSPITGPVPISTCGSSFDTVLDVYTGSCGALTSVACDDDAGPSCSGLNASVLLNATAGTTYYILAGGWNSGSGELSIVAGTPPTLSAGVSGTTVNLAWPTYYYPSYLLQQQNGPMGIGSGTWQDILPNTFGGASFPLIGQPPTFYRLVTP